MIVDTIEREQTGPLVSAVSLGSMPLMPRIELYLSFDTQFLRIVPMWAVQDQYNSLKMPDSW